MSGDPFALNAYVLGFMFDRGAVYVATIRKNRPAWQAGKLNGIGGKLEPGEDALTAMVREFQEETGCDTIREQWRYFANMRGTDYTGTEAYEVHCFCTAGDLGALKSPESESVEIYPVLHFTPHMRGTVENLPWLVSLASSVVQGRGPEFTIINYHPPRE